MDRLLLSVVPSYGKHQATLVWNADGMAGAIFHVFKSPDGVAWYELATVSGVDTYIDDTFSVESKLIDIHYKVIAELDGSKIESDTIGVFGTTNRKDFGIANRVMQEWAKVLRTKTEIKIYKQLIYNNPCPVCVDPDTDQAVGTTLCDSCFGTRYDKGFASPISSFMWLPKTPALVSVSSQDGNGVSDPQQYRARLLAYPPLRQGDMIVDPRSDDRWLVNNISQFSVAAQITVLIDANLSLLRRSDIRYKVV